MGAIAGIVSRRSAESRDGLAAALAVMRDRMRRRAPIEGGTAIAYDGAVGLAHRAGEGPGGESVLQPLTNETGTLWLVADGEPSNAAELRLELIAAGHCFRSACGNEVILHLYEQEGVSGFERLAGGFAFALWDRDQRQLLLGRDRLGEKPLYVADGVDRFCFASEARALDPGVPPAPAALAAYLTLGYVPEPLTVVPGVCALAPGSVLRVRRDRVQRTSLWTHRTVISSGSSEVDRAQLGRLVRETVQSAVAGEETVGIVLDGSLVRAALLALLSPTLGRGLRTHTLVFEPPPRRGTVAPTGARARRTLATWFGSEHREHHVGPAAIAAAFEATVGADQPSADGAFARLTAAVVSASGDRVWLSAVGGAELLGPTQRSWLPWVWRMGRRGAARALARLGSQVAARTHPGGRVASVAEWLAGEDPIAGAYLAARGLFAPAALAPIMRADLLAEARTAFDPVAYIRSLAELPPGPPALVTPRSAREAAASAIAAVERGGPLISAVLRDAERASCVLGTALRTPYLDHRLFEWVGTGDPAVGLSGAAVLADVLASTVPPRLRLGLGPPPAPPLDRWLRHELRPLMEAHLFADDHEGLFERAGIEELWRAFLAERVGWRQVWSLAVLRGWIDTRRERLRDRPRDRTPVCTQDAA